MTLKQLEALVWVSRLHGFNAAAKRLHTTQPAISIAIQKLEDEFGVLLIQRTRHFLHLTPKGRECFEYAERLLELAMELKGRIADKKHLAGTVKVGIGESIAMSWLPQLVSHLDDRYPGIKVDLEIGLTYPLLKRLTTSDIELALIGGSEKINIANYSTEYLGSLQFAWFSSGNYSLAENMKASELQKHRILTFSTQSATNRILSEWFSTNGARLNRTIWCDSMTSIASLTMSGLGISFLPEALFRNEIKERKLKVITARPPIAPFHFFAVYLRSQQSPITQIIAETAKQVSNFPRVA